MVILEGRESLGGTWDLFRYPGIRSDSDMHTLGYNFKPWTEAKAIADGPAIRAYIEETAREDGTLEKIRFNTRVVGLDWSDADSQWTVQANTADGDAVYRAKFVMMCSGYYSYDEGYKPDFPNEAAFKGKIIHPQFWEQDLDYADKKIVVIGSGATAMTIVPEMAKTAAKVVLLQRSPTYVVSQNSQDGLANGLRRFLPDMWAYNLIRFRNIRRQAITYWLMRRFPKWWKAFLLNMVRKDLNDPTLMEPHLTPRYDPWDQRICLVPDADLFGALNDGTAEIVTDTIDSFTENGIKLNSGDTLEADIIVTATGLNMKIGDGIIFSVNGETLNMPDRIAYKGTMFSDIPNLAAVFGYVNASWTLRADLISAYVARLVNHMDTQGLVKCVPIAADGMATQSYLPSFTSGYVKRAAPFLPKQGMEKPWTADQNYDKDRQAFLRAPLDDGALIFS